MNELENWDRDADGELIVQGLTGARSATLGPNVLLRLEWEGPVGAQTQTCGREQIAVRSEVAFQLGLELIRLSGRQLPAEPQGNA